MVVKEIDYRLTIKGLWLEVIFFTQGLYLILKEIGYTTKEVNWHGLSILKLNDLVFNKLSKSFFTYLLNVWMFAVVAYKLHKAGDINMSLRVSIQSIGKLFNIQVVSFRKGLV